MAAVIVHSDCRDQENKICHYFHFFSFYLPWSNGTRCHDLSFLNVKFQASFSLSSFIFIKRLFSLSSFSLFWLCHLQFGSKVVNISPCNLDSSLGYSSPAFCIMYFAYKLSKQGDNIQPWCTPFPTLNQSDVPRLVLTVASWPAYRFLRMQGRCLVFLSL